MFTSVFSWMRLARESQSQSCTAQDTLRKYVVHLILYTVLASYACNADSRIRHVVLSQYSSDGATLCSVFAPSQSICLKQ